MPDGPTLERLEDQIRWYDEKSIANQQRYKILKGAQLAAAAAIPVVATLAVHAAVSAGLGGLVLILEGFQQLNQYQQSWISYRSTCEALKHEKFLYLAGGGPYLGADRPVELLADRIEGLISQEHAKWVSTVEQARPGSASERPA